jgi:iron complex transport system substrate-binding protein
MTSLRMLIGSVCILPALLVSASSVAAVSVKDDAQRTITLDKPAQRIISLAPHATELLFEAGAAKVSLPSVITAIFRRPQRPYHR